MSTRVEKFEQLQKSLKKHFKPQEAHTERSVLEHLLYACCLEDARVEQADEAFAKLQQSYFDWNEVRVTTVIELSDVLSVLPNPSAAGHRIKRCLQSLFESRYQFDIEDMKKANLGKSSEELQAWQGMTPFVLNYVIQHALGGHSIPCDTSTLEALWSANIINDAELEKKTVPGLERAIPKNKGFEFASLLHQFAVEFCLNKKHPAALAVFKDLGGLPKSKEIPPPKAPKPDKPTAKTEAASKTKGSQVPAKSVASESGTDIQAAAPKSEPKTKAKDSTKVPENKTAETKPAAKSKLGAKTKDDTKGIKSATKAPPPKTAAKKGTEKPAAKPTDKKPAKPAKTSKSTDKSVPSKGKPLGKVKGKPAKKTENKKPTTPTKKPAKMANNVKITKKKPK